MAGHCSNRRAFLEGDKGRGIRGQHTFTKLPDLWTARISDGFTDALREAGET